MKSRIESIVAANMSSANYINGTIIPRARATFEKAAIRRTDDGGIIGAPLLSNDECNRPKGELRLDDIENMLNAFALNSHINNDPKYDDDFFLVMDHAIDPQTLRLRPRRAARLVAHAAHPQDRQRADAA